MQKQREQMKSKVVSAETVAWMAEEFRARRAMLNGVATMTRRAKAGKANSSRFQFGDGFELDLGAYGLRFSGEPLKLSRIPLNTLRLLIEWRGQLVSRDQIVEKIWGEAELSINADTNINETVRKIRKVLNDNAEQPRFLQTVHGNGYRFIAPVVEVNAGTRCSLVSSS